MPRSRRAGLPFSSSLIKKVSKISEITCESMFGMLI